VALQADGPAVIETWTVLMSRSGRTGIVVGRLDSTGERFLATTVPGDEMTLALLDTEEPVGSRLVVRSFEFGNRVAVDDALMDDLQTREAFAEDARSSTRGPASRLLDG
jgi:acetyl-CoA C-acetyltransferase